MARDALTFVDEVCEKVGGLRHNDAIELKNNDTVEIRAVMKLFNNQASQGLQGPEGDPVSVHAGRDPDPRRPHASRLGIERELEGA
eukprot:7824092-Pyramimonas_sp.AAC.1